MMEFTKLLAEIGEEGKAKAEASKKLNKFLTDHLKKMGHIEELKIVLGKFITA